MRRFCLILTVFILILVGCSNVNDHPTLGLTTETATAPAETTVPANPDPTETTEPYAEPVLQHPLHEEFLAMGFEYVQGKAFDMNYGTPEGELVVAPDFESVCYVYTGDSPEIELVSIGATLTLPEEWLDQVYVIQRTYGMNNEYGYVCVVSRAVMQAHRDMALAQEPDWLPEPLYRMEDYIFAVWNDPKEVLYYSEGFDPRSLPTYFGENETDFFYLITTGYDDGNGTEQKMYRSHLIEYYGQEYCDELVGDMIVDQDTAVEMITIHPSEE